MLRRLRRHSGRIPKPAFRWTRSSLRRRPERRERWRLRNLPCLPLRLSLLGRLVDPVGLVGPVPPVDLVPRLDLEVRPGLAHRARLGRPAPPAVRLVPAGRSRPWGLGLCRTRRVPAPCQRQVSEKILMRIPPVDIRPLMARSSITVPSTTRGLQSSLLERKSQPRKCPDDQSAKALAINELSDILETSGRAEKITFRRARRSPACAARQ